MEGIALRLTVLHSVNNDDGSLCVDIFRRTYGSIGFDEFRSDVEDPSGWFAVGGYGAVRYDDPEQALSDAIAAVPWFKGL